MFIGGFVPREPLYFTDLNLEIGTGVTVASAQITTPHRKNAGIVFRINR